MSMSMSIWESRKKKSTKDNEVITLKQSHLCSANYLDRITNATNRYLIKHTSNIHQSVNPSFTHSIVQSINSKIFSSQRSTRPLSSYIPFLWECLEIFLRIETYFIILFSSRRSYSSITKFILPSTEHFQPTGRRIFVFLFFLDVWIENSFRQICRSWMKQPGS